MTVLSNMIHFILRHAVSLPFADVNQMNERELQVLQTLASQVDKGLDIVEIGSFRGNSTISLAKGSLAGNLARVYAVGPHVQFVGPKGGVTVRPTRRLCIAISRGPRLASWSLLFACPARP